MMRAVVRQYGMGETDPTVYPVGTRFAVGGHVNVGDLSVQAIAGCFEEATDFTGLTVTRSGKSLFGYGLPSIQPYIYIKGNLATPMTRAQILSAFRFYVGYCNVGGSYLTIRDVDPVFIESVPGVGPIDQLPGSGGGAWDICNTFPSLCGSAGPLDKLASFLGVTPTSAAFIGAGAMLLAIVALKRVI